MMELLPPKTTDSLDAWLSYIEHCHHKPIDMGLERIKRVAEHYGVCNPAPYVITVAGTNGKGSTCKLLETALIKSGFSVGVYSSPHLFRYNERVRIQGKPVQDQVFIESFAYLEHFRREPLTYFEFGTLGALEIFRRAKVDIVILEVGLGGRLDATNVVDPDYAVITSIDIDHVEYLGDNREAIGREKAGIFRPNILVQIGEPDCPQSILDYAAELDCQLFRRDVDWTYSVESDRLVWKGANRTLNLPLPKIPLPNCATAIAVLQTLPFEINERALAEAVAETEMTGRFQRLSTETLQSISPKPPLAPVIIDVGHNPHAARYLSQQLSAIKSSSNPITGKIYAVFGVLADKDLSGIVTPLSDVIDQWHCAGLQGERGQSGESVCEQLHNVLPTSNATAYIDVIQASRAVFQQATEQDLIIVFGSFHTVANFMTGFRLEHQ